MASMCWEFNLIRENRGERAPRGPGRNVDLNPGFSKEPAVTTSGSAALPLFQGGRDRDMSNLARRVTSGGAAQLEQVEKLG